MGGEPEINATRAFNEDIVASLFGTNGTDSITGTPAADVIDACEEGTDPALDIGNDAVWGEDGDDILRGWGGDDTLVGGPGGLVTRRGGAQRSSRAAA